jgi:hypothetical protein
MSEIFHQLWTPFFEGKISLILLTERQTKVLLPFDCDSSEVNFIGYPSVWASPIWGIVKAIS